MKRFPKDIEPLARLLVTLVKALGWATVLEILLSYSQEQNPEHPINQCLEAAIATLEKNGDRGF
jgi:hypothetical protein